MRRTLSTEIILKILRDFFYFFGKIFSKILAILSKNKLTIKK
jgi:hypothetical protein